MNLTICLVAYNKKFTETVSYKQLISFSSVVKKCLNLVVVDNGKKNYTETVMPSDFLSMKYYFNPNLHERGTRVAYQYVLETMEDYWLMLLDDDTELTEGYIQKVLNELGNPEINAFCPLIFDGEVQISPTQSETIKNLNFPQKSGVYIENITGISSGLVLSKKFMLEIKEFSKEFPLDYLDHWIFWQLRNQTKKIKVIDEKIQHHLSVQHLKELSKERFITIFTSEYHYYQHYQPEQLYSIKKKYVKMIVKAWLKGDFFPGKALIKIILEKK